MSDRRAAQFALEVVFLAALAAALAFAKLAAYEIVLGMIVGWAVVAAFEWASWRARPHYGSGIPPKYYVPGIRLPPAQPLEQVAIGYPEVARDEAPTWIASADLRAEVLGEWPVSVLPPDRGEDAAEEPPDDPWTIVELPAEPLALLPLPQPELAPGPEPAAEPEPEPDPEPAPELEPAQPPRAVPLSGGTARYHLEPLAEPAARRVFGRRGAAEPPPIEVPDRPRGVRGLPGTAGRS
jgi:hypothetical protein